MFGWLRRLFRNRQKPRKVVLDVTNELYQLYTFAANREGLTLPEWVRRSLNKAVPSSELKRLEQKTLHAAGIEAAYQQLDRDEAAGLTGLSSGGDAIEARAVTSSTKAKKRLPMVPGHPCRHLSAELPPGGSSQRDGQGTCTVQERMCHWPAAVASQCPVFRNKIGIPTIAA